jgi:hypothetical protein
MEDWQVKEARKRVKKLKSFYSNFGSWIVFSIFFIFLNVFTSSGFFWAIFPILGWGIGVAFQAFDVFGVPGFGKNWEEEAFKKEIDRIKYQQDAEKWYKYEQQQRSIPPPKDSELDFEEYRDELELKDFRRMKKEWRDSDFV